MYEVLPEAQFFSSKHILNVYFGPYQVLRRFLDMIKIDN